jgi:hypothetical protein
MIQTMLKWALIVAVLGVSIGCGSPGTRADGLRSRLYGYSAAIRWNEIDKAVAYLDPLVVAEHPPSAAELARWQQVQVSRYVEGAQALDAQGRVLTTAQIELIDRATQTVRSIVDRQIWRYDEASKTWWLASGLPQLDPPQP